MEINKHKRIDVFDAIKFFAIYLVILGHCIQYFRTSHTCDDVLYRFIYSFHMPLFMMVSGFFSANVHKKNARRFFIDKSRQLLLPNLIFSIYVFVILYGVRIDISHYFVVLYCNLWFLKSAFICAVLHYLCARFRRMYYPLIGLTLLFSQIYTGAYSFNIGLMYPCFIVGVFLANKFEWIQKHYTSVLYISFAIFMTMLFLCVFDEKVWGCSDDMKIKIYSRFYKIVMGIAGAIAFILLFMHIEKYKGESQIWNHMCRFGRFSLGVYCFQTVILEISLARYINLDRIHDVVFVTIIAPLVAAIIMIICISSVQVTKKSRLLSFLMLGEKWD